MKDVKQNSRIVFQRCMCSVWRMKWWFGREGLSFGQRKEVELVMWSEIYCGPLFLNFLKNWKFRREWYRKELSTWFFPLICYCPSSYGEPVLWKLRVCGGGELICYTCTSNWWTKAVRAGQEGEIVWKCGIPLWYFDQGIIEYLIWK